MKNIYKLSIVLLSVFTFIGCNVDDDDQQMVLEQKSITASLANQSAVIATSDFTTTYELVVNFSEALPSYSTIEYSLNGVTSSANASSGDTSLVIPVLFEVTDNYIDVEVSDFIVVNAQARRFVPSIEGNTMTRIVRESFWQAIITWDDPANDIDFGIQPMTSFWGDTYDWIDTSLGVTNVETLEGSLDDGNYAILAAFYTAPTDVNINIALQTAAGDFSFDLLASEDFANVLWFTKSTDTDGTVSYTFYTEDPS